MDDSNKQVQHKSTLQVFLIVLNASLGAFLFGYHIGVFNPLQDNIEQLNRWSDDDAKIYDGLVTSFMPLGGIFGAALAGLIAGKLGRKNTFIIMDVIGIIGGGILMIKGLGPLLAGRLINGFAIGVNSAVVPLYINEITPQSIQGVLGSMTQLMVNVGIQVAFCFGLALPKYKDLVEDPDSSNWWRFMFAFPIITCVLRIVLLLTIYNFDTPYFYSNISEDTSKAKEVLQRIYRDEFVDSKVSELQREKEQQAQKVGYGELFGPRYLKRLIIGIMLSFFQQFCGINAVLFYSDKIFKGDDPHNATPEQESTAKTFTAIIGAILIVASYIGGVICDKFGRKSILIVGEISCIITLAILAALGYAGQDEASKYVLLVYLLGFGISLGPIVWLYLPEILPENGVALGCMGNWIFTFLIGFLFPILKDAIQIQGCFLVFLACCGIGLVFIFVFVKETKGQSKDEIEMLFTGKDEPLIGTDTSE